MSRPLVTVKEHVTQQSRILVCPKQNARGDLTPIPARSGPGFQEILPLSELPRVIKACHRSRFVAVDWETKGNDYSLPFPEFAIVGLGLAWDRGSCYFQLGIEEYGQYKQVITDEQVEQLRDFLTAHKGLIAHNVYFDGGVVRSQFGVHAEWAYCTLAIFMLLSNEGWAGQTHGLKQAQTELLLWDKNNEGDLGNWLCRNGFYKGVRRKNKKTEEPLTPDELSQLFEEGGLSPDKGEMWRAPMEIIGKYCILDAESCYLLFTEILFPVLQDFPNLKDWYELDFSRHIALHIEQKMHGLVVDVPALHELKQKLLTAIKDKSQQILEHPKLKPHIEALEASLLAQLAAEEPPRYKKSKPEPKEPKKFTKNGDISKGWLSWEEKMKVWVPQKLESSAWKKWNTKYELAKKGEVLEYKFNPQSNRQLARILYDGAGFPVRIFTESGDRAVGVKALKQMGEVGHLFVERAWDEKELGYVESYLEKVVFRNTVHPNFRLPGTKTGRLTSSEINLQQIPKTKSMMNLFRCRPGNVLVDLDFTALEPMVTTEFSQDKNMEAIYGNGRPANDLYLFVAASIPGYKEKVLAAGYDPYNPSKEGLANAKKVCKTERSVCKTVALACAYGASVNKVMQTLEEDDVFLPFEEVKKIHTGYWELFKDVKQFGYNLQKEWSRNGGFLINGLGRPMCITEDYKHDALNRFIQSTGHDILVMYCGIVTRELEKRNIQYIPYVIDWHDSCCVEVPEAFEKETVQVFLESLDVLNATLNGNIKLRGVPTTGITLTDVKEPES